MLKMKWNVKTFPSILGVMNHLEYLSEEVAKTARIIPYTRTEHDERRTPSDYVVTSYDVIWYEYNNVPEE